MIYGMIYRSQCCQTGHSHSAYISYTYKNNASATVGRAGSFWFKWPTPNKSLCASRHLTTRLQWPKKKLWSFKCSKSAPLGRFPYMQRLFLDTCLIYVTAWNWKHFNPHSGLQGLPVTLGSYQSTCMLALLHWFPILQIYHFKKLDYRVH